MAFRRLRMSVTYRKLRHLLIERKMLKKELQEKAGLSQHVMLMLSRDENVTTETLGKICSALECSVDDIIEFIPDDEKKFDSK